MAFCASCGAEAKGAYCEQCGAPLSSPDAIIRLSSEERAGDLPENVVCALCYFLGFVTGVLFLVWPAYNKSPKVRFHAIQSVLFSAFYILIVFTVGVVLPWGLSQILAPVIQLGSLAIWLHIMWQVYKEREVVLPVLGDLAKKQA
ncbi:MAG: hypothetical protein ABI972_05980 [Acidobacteriota bacterium]